MIYKYIPEHLRANQIESDIKKDHDFCCANCKEGCESDELNLYDCRTNKKPNLNEIQEYIELRSIRCLCNYCLVEELGWIDGCDPEKKKKMITQALEWAGFLFHDISDLSLILLQPRIKMKREKLLEVMSKFVNNEKFHEDVTQLFKSTQDPDEHPQSFYAYTKRNY